MNARPVITAVTAAVISMAAFGGTPFTKPARPGRAPGTERMSKAAKRVSPYDTVRTPAADSIVVAGFEKTLRSNRESMYVSNRTSSPIEGLGIDITYLDMKGRMLHRSSHDISETVPAGETRLVDLLSFDRQGLYYYHLSPVPSRASRATPFQVKVAVSYILIPKSPTSSQQ